MEQFVEVFARNDPTIEPMNPQNIPNNFPFSFAHSIPIHYICSEIDNELSNHKYISPMT